MSARVIEQEGENKMKQTYKIARNLTGKSIWVLILVAFLSISALADGAIWTTSLGEFSYSKHFGTTSVLSTEKSGSKTTTWLFINNIDQSLPDSGSYSGYWIDNSGRQLCEAELVDPYGTRSRNWGRFEITFEKDNDYPTWTGTLGDCFKQPDRILKATKPKDIVDSSVDSTSGSQTNYLITAKSAGNIRLGMTVAEARKLLKGAKFTQTPCGMDQDPEIKVERDKVLIMNLIAWEGSEDDCNGTAPPIKENAKITSIEVFDSRFRTANGIHPGISITDAEKIYGKIEGIFLDPSGEDIRFVNHPKSFGFGVRGKGENRAGVYNETFEETTRYTSGAYVYSVIISDW
jgi:hypothetical protein